MNKNVVFQDLGLVDYKKCWDYQESIFSKILQTKSLNRSTDKKTPTENHVIFCEHPHVYTLGKNGDKNNLLVNSNYLKKRGADFYRINRGGDITYHGPGQIVCYPILDLENFFLDIHKYLRSLEEIIILTLKEYNLIGERSKGETGVWFDVGSEKARKICALGVKNSRWVTMHGLAFNINTDLSYFNNIIPCGIANKTVTSLEKELGIKVNVNDVKEKIKLHFLDVFEMETEQILKK